MIKDTEIKETQNETERQRSFIELARALTQQKMQTIGRPLTYCLTTFGCQMNEKQSEAVAGSWMRSDISVRTVRRRMLLFTIPVPSVKMPI